VVGGATIEFFGVNNELSPLQHRFSVDILPFFDLTVSPVASYGIEAFGFI
jgi:hypothetical protein